MISQFLAPKFLVLYAILGSALYVHLRGRERFHFTRQLFNHSTLLAPYNALVFLFSGVPAKAFQDVRQFPDLAPLRDNWKVLREEAQRLVELRSATHATAESRAAAEAAEAWRCAEEDAHTADAHAAACDREISDLDFQIEALRTRVAELERSVLARAEGSKQIVARASAEEQEIARRMSELADRIQHELSRPTHAVA